MASKGAVTISHEELARMKMKANLIPNGIASVSQLKMKIICPSININRAKKGPISGLITPKTLKNGKNRKGIASSRKNSSNAEKLMKKRNASSKKRKNNN